MSKAQLLETLRTERARWDALVSSVGEVRMTKPDVKGEWSVKDTIARVTWYEREAVGVLRARALVGSALWELPQDQRNGAVFEENRGRPLDEVLAEAQQAFYQLVEAGDSLSEEELVAPLRFPGMPAAWMPWKLVASNSYEHYRQHIPSLQAWLGKGEGPA